MPPKPHASRPDDMVQLPQSIRRFRLGLEAGRMDCAPQQARCRFVRLSFCRSYQIRPSVVSEAGIPTSGSGHLTCPCYWLNCVSVEVVRPPALRAIFGRLKSFVFHVRFCGDVVAAHIAPKPLVCFRIYVVPHSDGPLSCDLFGAR